MATQSLYKNSRKLLRKTKKLYYTSVESQKDGSLIKTLAFQSKLHALIEQSRDQDPTERLTQLDVKDIPLEAMQKWVMQIAAAPQR